MTLRNSISDSLDQLLGRDVRAFAQLAAKVARNHGTQAVLVGGAVRDMLMGQPAMDADIMIEPPVDSVAQELAHLTGGELISHPQFQTYVLKIKGVNKVDIVTSREETYPKPAVLPVVKPSTIEKDLARRDFSINAMVCKLDEKWGDIFDPLGGQNDLEARRIRAIHEKSFIDDPTRIFRAARFAGRLGFSVEENTLGWIESAIQDHYPDLLSPVRRRHEFELLLKEENPKPALSLLQQWGAIRTFHPEWTQVDLSSVPFDTSKRSLMDRLTAWFSLWDEEISIEMMNSLQFEKTAKQSVINALKRKN